MAEVVLYQPEIAPNTGNIIRLCANAGARLHLVKPLGFSLNEKSLRRAGMDYAEIAQVEVHEDWGAFCRQVPLAARRIFALTTRGSTRYDQPAFAPDDMFLFGPETRGLPDAVLAQLPQAHHLRIPMQASSRSMNLSNAVAVMVYEAWRQHGFAPPAPSG